MEWTNHLHHFVGDDPLTTQKDGFLEGDKIRFEVKNEGTSKALQVDFDHSLPQYDGLFHSNGLSAIKAIEINSAGIENITESSFDFYPNPADEILHISKGFAGKVELCFKWIKQHLKVKSFWGISENAVRMQNYSAIIAYCLVAIVGQGLKINKTTYEILQILGVSLFDKTPLK